MKLTIKDHTKTKFLFSGLRARDIYMLPLGAICP